MKAADTFHLLSDRRQFEIRLIAYRNNWTIEEAIEKAATRTFLMIASQMKIQQTDFDASSTDGTDQGSQS